MHQSVPTLLTAALALTTLAAGSAEGQGWADRLKKRAEKAIEKKVGDKVEGSINKTADSVLGTGNKASDATATTGAKAAGGSAAKALGPGEGTWANYDFKPGERLLVVEDFSSDQVGNFPRRFEFKGGNIEIVEWQGARWLKSGDRGEFIIPLPEVLPERFTMEFDLTGNGNGMEIHFVDPGNNPGQNLNFSQTAGGVQRNGIQSLGSSGYETAQEVVKARILADGDYVKVFVNEKRVANVPNAKLGRSNKIYILLNGWSEEKPRMIANITIAAGGKSLYDALAEKGRVATQGIYFNTGSDRLRPESTPTLKEIGAMLSQHPDLRLVIEGHTDATGNAAANQTLSQQRAEAVKSYLVTTAGVDQGRLVAKGLGASKPADSNDTPAGRQTNRRVELVRM